MKKLYQTIKLRKLKTEVTKDSLKNWEGHEFYILYNNNTWEWAICQEEVIFALERDHLKPIRYIFDATDRIIIDRKILIDTDIKEE